MASIQQPDRSLWIVSEMNARLQHSMNGQDSEAAQQRIRYLNRYMGRPLGNERRGWSKTITRETFEAIQWTKPALIRAFVTHPRPISFLPVGSDDEDAARQETSVVNHIIYQQSKSFSLFDSWFTDMGYAQNGYVKVFWDSRAKPKTTTVPWMDTIQLGLLDENPAVEIISATPAIQPPGIPGWRVEYVSTEGNGRIEILPTPPEEVRPESDAQEVSLDRTGVFHQRRNVTRSELLEMGYPEDVVWAVGEVSSLSYEERDARRWTQDEQNATKKNGSLSRGMEEIELNEFYGHLDVENNGRTEYYRVLWSGGILLEAEPWDVQPFCTLSCYPNSHRHYGESMASSIYHIEREMTVIKRGILDNLYRVNSPRMYAGPGVNLDQLTNYSPYSVVETEGGPGQIQPEMIPVAFDKAIGVMEWLQTEREAITGVSRNTMGLDPEAMAESTMGAFMKALGQASQRLEMLTRNVAETGMKELALKVHHLLRKHQDVPMTVKIAGQWTEINPSEWREREDMEVSVGLGKGSPQEILASSGALLEIINMAQAEGLSDINAKYRVYVDMAIALGKRDVDRYLIDPASPEGMQIQQQRAMAAQQQGAELEQAIQNQQSLQVMDMTRKAQESQDKIGLEYAKLSEDARQHTVDSELEHNVNLPGGLVSPVTPLRRNGGNGNA